MTDDTLSTVDSVRVRTDRLDMHILTCGPQGAEPVVFVHGNISSAAFWRQAMRDLSPGYRALAVDLRGFGGSESLPVDATRGLADYADDVASLVDTSALGPVHLVGWSMGGGVCLTLLRDRPELVRSVTLVNPVSPYGYGGSVDVAGTLAYADNAGCGAGAVNPEFVQRLGDGDRSDESASSPRNVMNTTYWKPPFRAAEEDVFLDSMLQTCIGDDFYPGDPVASPNWPGMAPGSRGVLNTMSRGHLALELLLDLPRKPPVLWLRGSHDVIVSDASALDLANLGKLGIVPGWPGDDVCPPQPMVGQTRHFLNGYAAAGGSYREVVVEDAGHSPHVEKPAEFAAALTAFLAEVPDGRSPADR